MKVYEAIAAAVAAEEGGPLFGLMGDGNLAFWGAYSRLGGTTIHSARNEAGAVAMADGYFRATGDIGVCTVTCGPGLTQTGTSLIAAQRNRSSIVVLTGEISAGAKNKLQTMDQRRFAEACGARVHSITSSGNAAEEIAEAFYAARIHRCPVVLNMPINIQEQSFDWPFEYRPSRRFSQRPRPPASAADLSVIADMLARAERPVIVAGRGAKLAGARDEILRLAAASGALVATSLKAKGLFMDEPFDLGVVGAFSSRPTERLMADADFVLGIGAELGYFTSEGGLLFPSAEVARIDIAPMPEEIGVAPGFYACADALEASVLLNRMMGERLPGGRAGYRSAETAEILDEPTQPFAKPQDGLDQRALMRHLSEVVPADAVVTCGVGHYWHFVAMYLVLSEGAEMHFSNQFGAVGQTLPIAFGVGAASRGRPHIVIEGDGSLMMNLQELETVVREGQSMVLIVMNDSGYGAEVHKLAAIGHDPALAQWRSPDFVALARAFGGDGVRLNREEDLMGAMREGLRRGGLYLIDAPISPSTLSDPFSKLHAGAENNAPLLRRAKKGA